MQTAFRVLDSNGISMAAEWARREGWNPGLADAEAFAAADPEGFIGLYADGELAATISLVSYGSSFGFLGFYICRPDLRGKGLGLALWNHAIARCTCRTIGLDGVTVQQANYRKSGFVLAHENIRYGGAKPTGLAGPMLAALTEENAEEIGAYELRHHLFPAPRLTFLRKWLGLHRGFALKQAGVITGYGVIRACHEGYKIGPLFAANPQDAQAILAALLGAIPDGSIFYLDVPGANPEAIALAASLRMQPIFETARMYRGLAPNLNIAQTFGITSFELG